jgi:hypothetical protein
MFGSFAATAMNLHVLLPALLEPYKKLNKGR